MFELQTQNSTVSLPAKIQNFDSLKTEIQNRVNFYKNLVITENGLKQAKTDRASLNRLKKAIAEQRLSAKNQCLGIYAELEKQCRELESLISEPISEIDAQIKSFEKAESDKKFAELQAFFDSLESRPDWLTLESVVNPKWANKGESLESLKEDISRNTAEIKSKYDDLCNMYKEFPFCLAVLENFKRTKNFGETLVYAKTLEEEYKKQSTPESVQNNAESVSDSGNEVTPQTEQTAVKDDSETPERILTGCFKVTCTVTQLKALRDFMLTNKIKFEIVKGDN